VPNNYVVLDEGDLVLERWSGDVSIDEMVSHENDQLQDERINRGASVLADCTQASLVLSPDQIEVLTAPHANPLKKTSISRYALLLSDESFDTASLVARQVKKYGMTVIAFNSLDIACCWLGIDPEFTRESIRTIPF
jgi:hypothetical protein